MTLSERVPFGLRVENALVAYAIVPWEEPRPRRPRRVLPRTRRRPTARVASRWPRGSSPASPCSPGAWRARAVDHRRLAVVRRLLVPVIGLVQVGSQAMADRYAYLPMIGLSIAVGTRERRSRSAARPRARATTVLAVVAVRRVDVARARPGRDLKDDRTLFTPRRRSCPRATSRTGSSATSTSASAATTSRSASTRRRSAPSGLRAGPQQPRHGLRALGRPATRSSSTARPSALPPASPRRTTTSAASSRREASSARDRGARGRDPVEPGARRSPLNLGRAARRRAGRPRRSPNSGRRWSCAPATRKPGGGSRRRGIAVVSCAMARGAPRPKPSPKTTPEPPRGPVLAVFVGLALITIAAFGRVAGNAFLELDDRAYVVDNPRVRTASRGRGSSGRSRASTPRTTTRSRSSRTCSTASSSG
jgi:hypothetical protein